MVFNDFTCIHISVDYSALDEEFKEKVRESSPITSELTDENTLISLNAIIMYKDMPIDKYQVLS